MSWAVADWRSGLFPAVAGAILGALAGALALDGLWLILASAFLAATMGAIAVEDMRHMRVPDAWDFPAALGGFIAVALGPARWSLTPLLALGHAAVSLIICGGIFYLLREVYFRMRGVEGLGFGDVKLAATGGIWVGWEAFPVVVLIAAFAAIVWVAVATALRRGWPRAQKVPFGAFLAPAIWICWLYWKMVGL